MHHRAHHRRQTGFTLLGLLFLVAGLGVGLAALGTLWHTAAQRQREAELLFVGEQYRRAIESFWKASPKGQERLPTHLEELLLDPRHADTVRHLRRLYPDPMSADGQWELVRDPAGGILALHSRSAAKPFKTQGFAPTHGEFAGKRAYREWVFAAAIGADGPAPRAGGTDGAADQRSDDPPNPAPATPPAAAVEPPPPERHRACVLERRETQISVCGALAGSQHLACQSAAQSRYLACLRGR